MMAAYGKVKELAKDKVNEKIIPVLKQRKRPDSSLSSPLMPTVAGQDSKTDTLSASSMETTQETIRSSHFHPNFIFEIFSKLEK